MALTEASLYSPLPKFVTEKSDELGTKAPDKTENRYVKTFMKRHVRNELLRKERANIPNEYSSQMLDAIKLKKPKDVARKKKAKKRAAMSNSERAKFKAYEIKPEHQKYEMYEMLHDLWKDYMSDLVDFTRIYKSGGGMQNMRLMKADYHGAIFRVVRSKNPSLVGAEGIVLQEMKNVFKIITKENRVKTLPKRKTVFSFEVEGHRATLYGDSIMLRPADRSHKKYKLNEARMSLDL